MKLFLSATIIVALLAVDGMLANDPFDSRSYSLGDLPGLLLALFCFGWIVWHKKQK
jgi:hypothetical protein